ncbi:hypothetical protein V6N11_068045 [Hibiscus sabdariffa]|uniref:Reverse transcriptase zinc-binding domain-containing protein n=1 Tax=Hibiscus sabdariffa TaxID=183260 RepID=A0ABR2ST74_9ROSI
MVKENIVWQLGDGRRVQFWKDCWLASEGPLLSRTVDDRTPPCPDALVADMVDGHGQWRWDLLDQTLPCELLLRITAVKPPLGISYDVPGWAAGTNNEFTVRSEGVVSRGVFYGPFERVWRVIAEFKGLPRVRMFLWLVCHERVLMNAERRRRRLTQDSSCAICGDDREDLDHLLRFCPSTIWFWNQLIRSDAWNEFNTLPIKEWMLANLLTPTRFVSNFPEWPTLFPYILWNLWKRRNEKGSVGTTGEVAASCCCALWRTTVLKHVPCTVLKHVPFTGFL